MNRNLAGYKIRPIQPSGFTGVSSGWNRWDISELETYLCLVVFIGCILLHFVPVYNRFGLPIEVGLSLISFATPISGLLYLSAAQVIPDAPGCPLPVAQMALAGFFLWQFVTGKRVELFRMGRPLWIAAAPFFVWDGGLAMMRGDYRFETILLFAILTGCVAAVLVGQSGNRLVTCLVIFLAGHGLAMCLFWIIKLHLGTPVQAFAIDVLGDSLEQGARIGTARGNANMLGGPMALACIGAFGWFYSQPKQTRLTGMVALLCLAAAVPPLIGCGERGAFIALCSGVVFLLLIVVSTGRSLTPMPLTMAWLLMVIILGWHPLGLDEHWQEMTTRQQVQQIDTGTIYAGRTLEWTAAWRAILDSPIIGGGHVERLSYLEQDVWMSHSTYLDVGLIGGFPGMALFCWLVLKPVLELWRRVYEPIIMWLLAVYVVSIISIGSTSAIQFKHFWMLWGIATVLFLPAVTMGGTRQNHLARRADGAEHSIDGGGQMPEEVSRISEIRDQRSLVQ
jgi:O-antigen ligase